MLFLVFCVNDRLPTKVPPCRGREPGPPQKRGVSGEVRSEITGGIPAREQGVGPNSRTPDVRSQASSPRAPHHVPVDEKRQDSGEVSEHGPGFTSGSHGWT